MDGGGGGGWYTETPICTDFRKKLYFFVTTLSVSNVEIPSTICLLATTVIYVHLWLVIGKHWLIIANQ